MQCSTPVIASNTSAIPEIAGDAAILIDPLDVNAITHAIEMLLYDSKLCEDLRNRGKERVAQFSWYTAAEVTRNVLVQVSERRCGSVGQAW